MKVLERLLLAHRTRQVTHCSLLIIPGLVLKMPSSPFLGGSWGRLIPGSLPRQQTTLEMQCNTEAVFKKGQNRLYRLFRKLRSFSVFTRVLHIFYKSVVERTICFAAIYWGSSIRASDSKKLNKLIKKAGSLLGTDLELPSNEHTQQCMVINGKKSKTALALWSWMGSAGVQQSLSHAANPQIVGLRSGLWLGHSNTCNRFHLNHSSIFWQFAEGHCPTGRWTILPV